ncbi:MAG: hypothetical protein AAFZ80_09495 [Cyanobacteria bacterium P01_A01_bin.105]
MKQTRRLLAGAYLSSVVFIALASPLVWLGNKHMVVEMGNQTVFAGSIRRVMTPYLFACGVLGLSAGGASVAIGGWRETARLKAKLEHENSQLRRDLSSHQQELEDILLYNDRLQSMALDGFFPETAADTLIEVGSPSVAAVRRATSQVVSTARSLVALPTR